MISLAEGFGFNTNLLETNILNLAVVLPLVFSLGKDTLTKILDLRREKILESLRNADDRFKQAQLKLDAAKSELAGASETVKEIQRERDKTIAALRLEETRRYEELYQYYDNLEKESIRIAEEKILTSVRDEMINEAFAKVMTYLTEFSRMDPSRLNELLFEVVNVSPEDMTNNAELLARVSAFDDTYYWHRKVIHNSLYILDRDVPNLPVVNRI
jgi:F-type H+-transporting ATPase subunit b